MQTKKRDRALTVIDAMPRAIGRYQDALEFTGKLLTTVGQPKTDKSVKYGFLTAVLHLLPSDLSGSELCAHKSEECAEFCLNDSGNPVYMENKTIARYWRSQLFLRNRKEFLKRLRKELHAHRRRAHRLGLKCAIRPNGTADVRWERVAPELFDEFSDCQWYDYTKYPNRYYGMPRNYHLTFSVSEKPESIAQARKYLSAGLNCAVVVSDCGISAHPKPIPTSFLGYTCVDGDQHDLTFNHPESSAIVLRAKGKARKLGATCQGGKGFIRVAKNDSAFSWGNNNEN